MSKRITDRLLTVKSIVTLLLTSAFVVLSLRGKVDIDKYLTIYTVVISFYYGTQSNKATGAAGGDTDKG